MLRKHYVSYRSRTTGLTKDLEAIRAVLKHYDACVEDGIVIPDAYKRRDPKEPGRAEKELAEAKLEKLVKQLFRAQEKQIREWMERQFIGAKQEKIDSTNPPDDILDDPAFIAVLIALVIQLANQGVEITNIEAGGIIDTVAIVNYTNF